MKNISLQIPTTRRRNCFMDKILGRTQIDNIEDREDGGTPGFMQVIKLLSRSS
jgi:hypothetical protein